MINIKDEYIVIDKVSRVKVSALNFCIDSVTSQRNMNWGFFDYKTKEERDADLNRLLKAIEDYYKDKKEVETVYLQTNSHA